VPFDRISIDPNVCHGQACIKGTRIPVHQIVRMLANSDTVDSLLGEYPSLSRENILVCLDSIRVCWTRSHSTWQTIFARAPIGRRMAPFRPGQSARKGSNKRGRCFATSLNRHDKIEVRGVSSHLS